MREFEDPFTGEPLDNPTAKTYEVIYTIDDFREKTYIDTLTEGKLTKEQAKEKVKGPAQMMLPQDDIQIQSIRKVSETDQQGNELLDIGGNFPWQP